MIKFDANEVVETAATEGIEGLLRWLKRLGDLKSDLTTTEPLYWRLKEVSPGAAFLLAYHLRGKQILIPAVDGDLDAERKRNPGVWVTGFAHILSPHILSRAQNAFEKGDVLCGLQRHYCAGCGPTPVVFNSLSDLEERIRSTRPGDAFMLVSVQHLAARNGLLAPTAHSVREWLSQNPNEEVFLINAGISPPTVESIWRDREQDEDVDGLFASNQELIAMPFIWEQDFFIDVKRPNERGEIPIGGAY
jgi:hypothetical protein